MTNRWVPRLRRAAFALGVGAIVWGAGLAIVLLVPDLTRAGDLPEAFGVPEPRVGDSVVYRFEVIERSWKGTVVRVAEEDAFHFTWLPPRTMEVPNGTRVVNDVLYGARTFMLANDVLPTGILPHLPNSYQSNGTHLLLDAGDGRIVALENYAWIDQAFTWCCGAGAGSNVTEHRWLNSTAFRWTNEGHHRTLYRKDLCGYVHALQGEVRPTREEVSLFSDCGAIGTTLRAPTFRAERLDRIGDEECVVYSQTNESERQRMSAWLCASLPYPARVEVHYAAFPAITARYDLARFDRGDLPTAHDSDATPSRDAVELVPRPPWGIDDAGVDHPFPLSAAHRTIENESMVFQEFRKAYPSLLLVQARFEEEVRDGAAERNWSLRWIGGDEALRVSVTRLEDGPSVLWHRRSADESMNETEARSAIPESVPTLRSLIARGADHADAGLQSRGVNSYEFAVEWTESDPCARLFREHHSGSFDHCRTRLTFRIGHERHTWKSEGEGPPERDGLSDELESHVAFDHAGQVAGSYESHIVGIHTPGPAATTQTGAGAAGAAMPSMIRIEAPDWQPSREVLWTGMVAAVLGVLAYAWAQAKGFFALGFFTRLERPNALAHPLRARLMDLIESDPGLSHNELVRRSELARPTAEHHLRKLVQLGLLVSQHANGRTCYYPIGRVDRRLMRVLPYLRTPAALDLLQAAQRRPGLATGEAAAAAGIDRATATYHLRRLERLGLVTKHREGRTIRIRVTTLADEALRSHGSGAVA